ncbi:hypothetical protein U8V72_17690 [Priestia filamentosa]|uniref:hypothetical protein n=1 Tax=Priestia filamentosa TaxID=1402861 RepID=UPI00397855B0
MDRTQKILNELDKMAAEPAFTSIAQNIKKIVADVSSGKENLMNYRQANSRAIYGDKVIDAIIEANKRQQDKH